MSSASNTKNVFASNLLQLQNFIKRDPTSYKDEFLQTYRNYESMLQVYLMKPSKPNKQLADLTLFLAHVSHCFNEELKTYPQQLIDILKKYSTILNTEMRSTFCRCLMLLRSKNLIEPVPLFDTFFSLMKCQDKALRTDLYTHMLNDVKKIKTKLKNYKLCTQVQQFVFTLTKDSHPMVAKYAVNLLVDLYKKQIWNDAKTVNVIANSCFSKITKVITLALQFFAGKDVEKDDESDSESDSEKATAQEILLSLRVGKKTKKRQKKTERALKAIRKDKKKSKNSIPHFSALNLIYDPQDFAEKLFKMAETTNEGFNIKLALLDLIARLTGIHSLYISNFHSFLIRFLNPHQKEVPKILWFAAISSHDLSPPDTVEPVLITIANNFITERNSSEVIAVGLNSIREICARCPLAMNEDLLGDLIEYRTYKDKAVSTAAKSLIQLFREKNPTMLQKKMRGKPTEESVMEANRIRRYGELDVKAYVPGAEIIEEDEEEDEDNEKEENEEEEWVETSDEEESEEDEEDEENKKPNKKQNRAKLNKAVKRKHSDEDEDDESEGEWVNISEEEENEQDNDPKKSLLTLEEKAQKAMKISSEKIFTQDDFKRIRLEQLKKKVSDKNFAKNKNKNIEIDTDSEKEEEFKRDGLVPISSITSINKKGKQDKEARLARVMEGRKERGKFGQRYKDDRLGKTNKEKRKTKAYMMLRHKINKKVKRSFKEKQAALRKSILKQRKMK